MRKLICERDIRRLEAEGETCCRIRSDTIVTPSARDAAALAGISFDCEPLLPGQTTADSRLTPELICGVLKGMSGSDELPEAFSKALMAGWGRASTQAGKDCTGVKLIQWDMTDASQRLPENPNVRCKSLTGELGYKVEMLEIDCGSYRWERAEDELICILDGTLAADTAGCTHTAGRGALLLIPGGASIELRASDTCCRMACFACPAAGRNGLLHNSREGTMGGR